MDTLTEGGIVKPDHKMVIRADAKAMGAVTALDTRASKRWAPLKPEQRKDRNGRPIGTSDCVSYYLDKDGNPIAAKVFKVAPAEGRKVTKRNMSKARKDEIREYLLSLAGNNSDVD